MKMFEITLLSIIAIVFLYMMFLSVQTHHGARLALKGVITKDVHALSDAANAWNPGRGEVVVEYITMRTNGLNQSSPLMIQHAHIAQQNEPMNWNAARAVAVLERERGDSLASKTWADYSKTLAPLR